MKTEIKQRISEKFMEVKHVERVGKYYYVMDRNFFRKIITVDLSKSTKWFRDVKEVIGANGFIF